MPVTSSAKDVRVRVDSFKSFFTKNANYPVAIDTYQRPYMWDKEKVTDLVRDLSDYINSNIDTPYYMGSILLHENTEQEMLFIIDGQQRITTLSILYYVLTGTLIDETKLNIQFNSALSIKNIQEIQTYLRESIQYWQLPSTLLNEIQFTFIITSSEDLAFTFFDTQNNRGVKLNATDLLKAYHLREITSEFIQKRCASNWERIQNHNEHPLVRNKKYFMPDLFSSILWRARYWRGQNKEVIRKESYDDILSEFMKNTIKTEQESEVPLYPNFSNVFGQQLMLTENRSLKLDIGSVMMGQNPADMPFAMRQPISKGLGFFLYSEKYADIVQRMYFDQEIDHELKAYRYFYEKVWIKTSKYLREIFVLASIMYFEKFQSKKLLEFALWLDHVLGSIRLELKLVFKETAMNFLVKGKNNLLDIISHSFTPEEVIRFLEEEARSRLKYYLSDESVRGKGVQGMYKDRVLAYYGKSDFTGKETWIKEKVQ
ncbi:DUF262 domain-containing protein [Rossellomorea vietnamensis]|uniref:DUF262 domain-containing protein n=1 Tax=Rossellomorea vietnamensis TaxID=218284 RepID=A0A5D4KBF9_9BACI|nr:DUF262 domain-containing protein [Rossellomorea vietnamensis]TYR73453.1 DUF262 domain-containing protein [Rossellomorea vietnamensis]